MPGKIERESSHWVLTWGSQRYEHKTRARALRQLRALHANDTDGRKDLLIEKAVSALNLPTIGLDPFAVMIMQPMGKEKLYVQTSDSAPTGAADAVLKLLKNAAGTAEVLPASELSSEQGDLLMARPVYKLSLTPMKHPSTIITTKAAVTSHWAGATLASRFFKVGKSPQIPFRVVKLGGTGVDLNADPGLDLGAIPQAERIVCGVVLEPGVIDGTKTIEDGEVVAEGDTYTEDEIRDAMYWWMEFGGRSFSYHHVELGGRTLGPQDVVVLENWQARKDYKEGEQSIPKGTWMLTARVNYLPLWNGIVSGAVNSWSIGADAMGQIVEVPAE